MANKLDKRMIGIKELLCIIKKNHEKIFRSQNATFLSLTDNKNKSCLELIISDKYWETDKGKKIFLHLEEEQRELSNLVNGESGHTGVKATRKELSEELCGENYRAILIVPWALPSTIAILAWQGLLNEQYGGVNNLLHAIGIAWNIPWMTNALWARIGLIIVNVWLGFPYMMNVCLGGLQAISTEYYEAAKMDGASKFQCFKSITLPMVTKLSIPLVISSFAANFNNFGNIYMITQGGPARVDNQFAGYTDILASTTYKMTTWSNRYELSATFSVLIFIIVGTFTLINMQLSGAFKEVD